MDDNRRRFLRAGLLGGAAVATGLDTRPAHAGSPAAASGKALRLLILGGTGFIGPHMVKEALRRGHDVSLFNRGRTNRELFPDLTRYEGDRDGGLAVLRDGRWDVVIDTSGYVPRLVGDAARLLAPRIDHYVFISTISVYGDPARPVTEASAVATLADERSEEVTGKRYGPLKALAEKRVIEAVGAVRSTILRPTYVCGPGDRTDRYTYWIVRSLRGGEMLWPGTPGDALQIIDVRDLARFAIDCAEQRTAGTFNTVTPAGSFTMGHLLEDCLAVTGADVRPTWVDAGFLAGYGLRLPVWHDVGSRSAVLAAVDGSRAAAAGLVTRPTRETARDTLAWWKTLPGGRPLRAGITAGREAALLRLWRAANA